MRANNQLKPCPFCGSTAYLYETQCTDQGWSWGVSCKNNDCSMGMDGFPSGFLTAVAAAKAWNTRPPAVPVKALRRWANKYLPHLHSDKGITAMEAMIDQAQEKT